MGKERREKITHTFIIGKKERSFVGPGNGEKIERTQTLMTKDENEKGILNYKPSFVFSFSPN